MKFVSWGRGKDRKRWRNGSRTVFIIFEKVSLTKMKKRWRFIVDEIRKVKEVFNLTLRMWGNAKFAETLFWYSASLVRIIMIRARSSNWMSLLILLLKDVETFWILRAIITDCAAQLICIVAEFISSPQRRIRMYTSVVCSWFLTHWMEFWLVMVASPQPVLERGSWR